MTRKAKAPRQLPGYTGFLQSLNLSVIALTQSNVSGDREKYLTESNHAISIGWKSTPVSSGKDHFDVRAELTVSVSKPKSDAHFLDLKVAYVLHIHAGIPFPPEYVERFCNSEVRLVIWPYFREYVTSTCGRMHIPPIFLPLAGNN